MPGQRLHGKMWQTLFVYFYKPDHLKERDGVQVGKEVLVWQREGGKHGENISEDTLWGEKDRKAKLDLTKTETVEDETEL